LEYTLTRRFSDFAEGDLRRSVSWSVEPQLRTNDQGERLPAIMQVRREAELTDGGYSFATINLATSGIDDLISRGNGLVKLPSRMQYAEYFRRLPRIDNVVLEGGVFAQEIGLHDYTRGLFAEVRWLPRAELNVELETTYSHSPDWLIWEQSDQFGTFTRNLLDAALDVNWFPAPQHELRARLQWLGLEATDPTAYRIATGGNLRQSGEDLDEFSINTLGFQLRYRWQFAPASDLYVVYSRGGFAEGGGRDGLGQLFERSLDLRDSDQFLVKVRYGF
jgi:hypothetical protein